MNMTVALVLPASLIAKTPARYRHKAMEAPATDALTVHKYGTRAAFGLPVDETMGTSPLRCRPACRDPAPAVHDDSKERWLGG